MPARVTPTIRARQAGLSKTITDISWKAQTRLCERYRTLVRKGKKPVVAVAAVGRELVGFVWAITRVLDRKPLPLRDGATSAADKSRRPKEASSPSRGGKQSEPPRRQAKKYVLDPHRKYIPLKSTKATAK